MDSQDSQVEVQLTDRGQVQTLELGPLRVTYLSGKDAGPKDRVFDMSMGEISVLNAGTQPVNLKYNAMQTFFLGHVFTFGEDAKKTYTHPRMEGSEPTDFVDYTLPAGQSLLLSQQDLLVNFQELGRPTFLDGHICTRFEGLITIDDRPQALQLGPICFHVDFDREWDLEIERHTRYSLERGGSS